MRSWLKEVVIVTIVASAIGLLDGELFYLGQVRGSESAGGWHSISMLGSLEINLATFVGTFGNLLSAKVYDLLKEKGVFLFYSVFLSVGSLFYLRVLEKISKDAVFSLVLSIWGIIGIVSSVRDFSTALAYLLSGVELLVLFSNRRALRLLFVPLCLIHFGVDSSYLLPLSFYLFSQGSKKSIFIATLLFIHSLLIICPGELNSVYSTSTTLLAFVLGITLALLNKSARLIAFSVFIPLLFFVWESVLDQRFPAGAFFVPLIVGCLWAASSPEAKSRLALSLSKLQQTTSNFLTAKNKIAFFWLCLAFIFFQTAAKFFHPINEAYLPKEEMDVFAEGRPNYLPLHPIYVGGYVGFRLAPLLESNSPLNYLDMSAKTIFPDSLAPSYRDYGSIWRGENKALFYELNPISVLCQGKDKLCDQLKADDHWKILSHSTLGDKILQKLGKLPVKQREIVSRRLEEESWYLLTKK